jgi:hypothetical protein
MPRPLSDWSAWPTKRASAGRVIKEAATANYVAH